MQCVFVSPDRIRSEDLCLHYRFMRELLCPPVLGTKDNYWSKVGKKGACVDLSRKSALKKKFCKRPSAVHRCQSAAQSGKTISVCLYICMSMFKEKKKILVCWPMEERDASRMAWALALSITTSSRLSRFSSDNSFLFPMSWASRQYMELSGTILISSGKW